MPGSVGRAPFTAIAPTRAGLHQPEVTTSSRGLTWARAWRQTGLAVGQAWCLHPRRWALRVLRRREHGSREAYREWLTGLGPHRCLLVMLDHILTRSESGHEYYAAGVALSGAAMNLNRLWDRARLPLSTWVWLAAVPIVCAAATRRIRSLSATWARSTASPSSSTTVTPVTWSATWYWSRRCTAWRR